MLFRSVRARRTRNVVLVAGMGGLWVTTGERWTGTRELATYTSSARDRWLQHRASTTTDQLLERTPKARRACAAVILQFTVVVPTGQRLPTHQIALVPTGLVRQLIELRRGKLLLPLPFPEMCERGKRTAEPKIGRAHV